MLVVATQRSDVSTARDESTNELICICRCEPGWYGAACSEADASLAPKMLALPPEIAIAGSIVAVGLLGSIVHCVSGNRRVQRWPQLVQAEVIDSILDFLTFHGLTYYTHGFDFDNDPDHMIAICILTVMILTTAIFIFSRCTSGRGEHVIVFLVFHILFEDGVQMFLYSIAASSNSNDVAAQMAMGFGILQCVFFFVLKIRDLYVAADDASASDFNPNLGSSPTIQTKKLAELEAQTSKLAELEAEMKQAAEKLDFVKAQELKIMIDKQKRTASRSGSTKNELPNPHLLPSPSKSML